jgi:hypothetical protein
MCVPDSSTQVLPECTETPELKQEDTLPVL